MYSVRIFALKECVVTPQYLRDGVSGQSSLMNHSVTHVILLTSSIQVLIKVMFSFAHVTRRPQEES